MKGSLLADHFAPCSDERLRFRIEESRLYERNKVDMVDFWDCETAEEYRQLEKEGKGVFDVPIYDPHAETITVKSRARNGEDLHDIALRVLKPQVGEAKGVFLFIHGGGFVIGSAELHDNVLRQFAERMGLVIASVEYRLAPEFKLPAATWDCIDAALHLLSVESEQSLGASLRFIGGESAGAYLTLQTTLGLRDLGINVRDRLDGIVSVYGIGDLSLLPSVRIGTSDDRGPVLPEDDESRNLIALALPKEVWNSKEEIKKAEWSPLYAKLNDLPPAMFTVGTEDSLVDDSVLLAARWELAGNDAELTIYPGSPHGYLVVHLDVTKEAIDDIVDFVIRHLRPKE